MATVKQRMLLFFSDECFELLQSYEMLPVKCFSPLKLNRKEVNQAMYGGCTLDL